MAAVLSAGRFNPADLFAEGSRSLPKQAAAVKDREQADGWGAAFYSAAGGLEIVKSRGPVSAEKDRFAQAVDKNRSGLALAHIRRASNPLGLPRKRLINSACTQPFSGNGFVFSHNGTLEIPAEIRSTLGKYEKFVAGDNDSEVLFWQLMKMLDAYGDPATALEMAVKEIRTVWLSVRDRHPRKKTPYNGLNIFLSDGRALWVLCHFTGAAGKEALMTPGWKSGSIAWRKDAGKAIFASEPLDDGPWREMSDPQLAEARLDGKNVTLKMKTLELE
ncbi:MAG: class II glutamine amidotransferase [Elusimicrobiales bacterium]|jgi:predicted glutamine amidotransferase